ncbi:LacI family DNA-binding transcriptional regulator [Curtobacterium sp. MCBD17_003]|uniref:LacI family DNA-binding transcriptional regulator n=1 Tax=Curtobacterium sp. MCBD17_003 TaxID=2175667 RepID=UPI000DA828D5|nr:LacI family DNA-binding transcriptional regulator [Curtobacterium sp. MCBD17_003]WIE55659.1 LacI family DNA-binding transcriptional regulator [Curtobacterium sp. MCBD17_003]
MAAVGNGSGPTTGRGRGAPTVKDIARVAEVSPMTVSRVLSGGKNVRPELQDRVERAIAEVGYHRNENARRLRQGRRSGLVGVLITNVGNPYYAGMLQGVEEVVGEAGRRIIIGVTNEDEDLEQQLLADFLGRQVEGLIVVPAGREPARFAPDALAGVPVVLASRTFPDVSADAILLDDIHGAFVATDRMLAEGHTRVGFLGNQVSVSTGRRRFEGFRQAHERHGLEPVDELVRLGQQDVSSAEQAMDQLLGLEAPPTAVFAANNRNSIGAIRAITKSRAQARDRGEQPAPIRLFGFDSFEFADMSPVPLSVVAHDAAELGRVAARMLFDRLDRGDDSAPRLVELPVEFVDFA